MSHSQWSCSDLACPGLNYLALLCDLVCILDMQKLCNCVYHKIERKRNMSNLFSSHESINQNIYVKKSEENLLEVLVNHKMCPLYTSCLVSLPEFLCAFCINVVNTTLEVPSFSGPGGISTSSLKASKDNIIISPSSFVFFLVYLVGTFEAQRDILSFLKQW